MNELLFKKCKEIKLLLQAALFKDAVAAVKTAMAQEMLEADKPEERERIYYENQAFDKLLDRLQSYANEVVMIEKSKEGETRATG